MSGESLETTQEGMRPAAGDYKEISPADNIYITTDGL